MYSEWKTAWKSELRKVKVKANNTLHILYLSTGRFSLKAVSMFKPSSFRKIRVKITWDKYYHKLAFCNKKKGFFSPFFFFFLFGTKYELICSLSRNLPPWYWEWLSHCGQWKIPERYQTENPNWPISFNHFCLFESQVQISDQKFTQRLFTFWMLSLQPKNYVSQIVFLCSL